MAQVVILIDEPTTNSIDFRDAAFGVFRTLT